MRRFEMFRFFFAILPYQQMVQYASSIFTLRKSGMPEITDDRRDRGNSAKGCFPHDVPPASKIKQR
jgi:hypothetical protein